MYIKHHALCPEHRKYLICLHLLPYPLQASVNLICEMGIIHSYFIGLL